MDHKAEKNNYGFKFFSSMKAREANNDYFLFISEIW